MGETGGQELRRLGYMTNPYGIGSLLGEPWIDCTRGIAVRPCRLMHRPRNATAGASMLRSGTWDEVRESADELFGIDPGSWAPLVGWAGVWFPKRAEGHRRWGDVVKDTGKPWRLGAAGGAPCLPFLGDCGRPIKDPELGLCGIHASGRRRSQEIDAAQQANWDAATEKRDREREAERRAREVLERLAPRLVALGFHRDTFGTDGKGSMRVPPEMLEQLTEMAAEFMDG